MSEESSSIARWWIRTILLGPALMYLVLTSGCAHQATVKQWQSSIQQTISEQSDADPSVLRAAPTEDGRRIYRINGQVDPDGSTDQVGVLVGDTTASGHQWFIFLLGTVKDHALEKARVAAMSPVAGRWQWAMGPDEPVATQKYQAYWARRWAKMHPNRAEEVQPGFAWPREADDFQMIADGSSVTVRELNSGAAWSLTINPPGRQGGS